MNYVPANRVKSNLYTAGSELQIKSTKTNYVGYYHRLWNGKIFAGKTPQTATDELEVVRENYTEVYKPVNQTIPNTDITNIQSRKLPTYAKPKPTETDYKRRFFVRYFAKKTNQPVFLEINKTDFDAIVSKDAKYVWENYIIVEINWMIVGTQTDVAATNKRTVTLTEKQNKMQGLSQFITNYSEYLVEK